MKTDLMKTKFMTNMTRTFNRAGLQIKKHSPEILLVTGIVTGGIALVAAVIKIVVNIIDSQTGYAASVTGILTVAARPMLVFFCLTAAACACVPAVRFIVLIG